MSISDSQKVDFLWKKIGFGAAKTDISTIKDATNEAIPSPLILRGDIVWIESDKIPNQIPTTPTNIVELYSDEAATLPTIETTEDITSSPRRTWLTDLSNWIPPEFGSTYQIRVYIDNAGATSPQTTGTQIFAAGSGNNDQWFFDYQPGVLNFIGLNLPPGLTTGKRIFISGARYIGTLGFGGDNGAFGDLVITDNIISPTSPNTDIILSPSGTGEVNVTSDLTVQRDLNVGGNVNATFFNGTLDGGFF